MKLISLFTLLILAFHAQGQYTKFKSDGSNYNYGLTYVVEYPKSYSIKTDDGSTAGLIVSNDTMDIRIFIVSFKEGWKEYSQKVINMTAAQFEKYMYSPEFILNKTAGLTPILQKFGFVIDSKPAAFCDFQGVTKINIEDSVVDYYTIGRVYVVYYNNFQIKLAFSVQGFDKNKLANEFAKRKGIFSYVANSFYVEVN